MLATDQRVPAGVGVSAGVQVYGGQGGDPDGEDRPRRAQGGAGGPASGEANLVQWPHQRFEADIRGRRPAASEMRSPISEAPLT